MDFLPGEILLWMHDGVEEMVDVVSGPDADGFFVIKRNGQPNQPISRDQLKRPAPELEVAEAVSHLPVGAVSEWLKVLNPLVRVVIALQESLDRIKKQVDLGERSPGSILELRERESLASVLTTIDQHRRSLIAAMNRDTGLNR
jgi:hypothetical protein